MHKNRLTLILPLSAAAFLGTALLQKFEEPRGISQVPGVFAPLLRPHSIEWIERELKRVGVSPLRDGTDLLSGKAPTGSRAIVQPPGDDFRLIFPHAPAGQGGGIEIQDSVFLLNNSGANADGTIFFYGDDGDPRSITTNLGTGTQFPFELAPGEAAKVETNETGAVANGWIEVVSNVLLSGSGTFTVFQSGSFVSEVGIADSTRSRRSLLFVDLTDGKRTGFAICNPDAGAVLNYNVQLKRLDGTEVASADRVLGPREQLPLFVDELFSPVDLSGFKGVLIISSESADFSVVTLRTRGLFFTSFPTAPRVEDTSDEGSLTFARLADGTAGDLKIFNTFQLMNNSDDDATATVRFLDAGGAPLQLQIGSETNSEMTVDVPANNAVELVSSGAGGLAVGSARVESTIPLAGGAAFTIVDAGDGSFQAEVGISDSPPSRRLTIFAQVEGDIDTGIGLTNIQEDPLTARLRLVGNAVGTAATGTRTAAGLNTIDVTSDILLQPGEAIAQFVSEVFSNVQAIQEKSFVGRLEVTGLDVPLTEALDYPIEADLAGVTLRARGAQLTSLPTAPYVVNFNPVLSLDLATDLEGSSPRTCFCFRQDFEERGIMRATIQLDAGTFDFSKLGADTQIAGDLIALIPLFGVTSHSRLFFTDVTSDSAVFYTPISINEVGEMVPFHGTLRSLPGGGLEFEIISNPPDVDPATLILPGITKFCLDAGLIRLPDGAGTRISVSEDYMSMQSVIGSSDFLLRNVSSTLTTTGLAQGAPRIESVSPKRVLGGTTIEVAGQGFSSSLGANSVTVEGNSRVSADVLEAGPERLLVGLPHGLTQGDLEVEVGGTGSNPYSLAVTFAPLHSVALGNPAGGQQTTLSLALSQRPGELTFDELEVTPSGGEWITNGFNVDQVIGQIQQRTSLDVPNSPLDETTTFELVVVSSDADDLVLNAIEEDDDDPTFIVQITRQSLLRVQPAEAGFPTTLPFSLEFEVDIQVPILQLPAGPALQFESRLLSQSERIARPVTRRVVLINQTIDLS